MGRSKKVSKAIQHQVALNLTIWQMTEAHEEMTGNPQTTNNQKIVQVTGTGTESFRALLAIVANRGLIFRQFDFTTAFLN